MTLASHLSLHQRKAAWKIHYPGLDFWQNWHMAMLEHGSQHPPSSVSVMAPLYHPASPRRNPASDLLFSFEKRSLLSRLPSETRVEKTVPRSLLDACASATPQELAAFWGDLGDHFQRHAIPEELPSLNEAAQALRLEMQCRGRDPDSVPDFFPGAVADPFSYAALARAVLFLALIPGSPCRAELYCASNSEYVPYDALTLNLILPESFLQGHGLGGRREVRLGLYLAASEQYQTPLGSAIIPVLNHRVSFGTLFAPDLVTSSRLRQPGRSATLYLQ